MSKVGIGELVCLYRRRKKGLGVVIEIVDDARENLNLDNPSTDALSEVQLLSYGGKQEYIEKLIKKSTDAELSAAFFAFNSKSWCKKPKYQFAKVRWLKIPSFYTTQHTIRSNLNDTTWVPTDWVRVV